MVPSSSFTVSSVAEHKEGNAKEKHPKKQRAWIKRDVSIEPAILKLDYFEMSRLNVPSVTVFV